MFRKFTKLYMVFILLLIIFGLGSVFISGEPSEKQLEDEAWSKAPGYETMTAVSEIVIDQYEENALLDIQVTPIEKNEEVLLKLQGDKQYAEDELLMDSYHLLIKLAKIEPIESLTISWFMLVENENVEALTMTFDRKTLNTLSSLTYEQLPSVALNYTKHEKLR